MLEIISIIIIVLISVLLLAKSLLKKDKKITACSSCIYKDKSHSCSCGVKQ